MNDETLVTLLGVGAVVVALVVLAARRAGSREREIFSRLALDFGWQEVRPRSLFGTGVRGTWNLFPVRLEKRARYKSVPERLILRMDLQSPGRIVITRRFGSQWWNQPMVLFGPRVVTPPALSDPERFWVRSNEPAFVERLFADARIAELLEANLVERFDALDLQPNRLTIRRATDERRIKKQLNRPTFEWRSNPAWLETVARAEWELAKTVVGQLTLRPS